MKFHVLTLFPEMIRQGLNLSILGRAAEKNIIELHPADIRSYTQDRHGKVDDYLYGGGAGMLLQAQPVYDAYRAVAGDRKVRTIYVTPQGRPFDQKFARELSREKELVILCGHYEGIDERVLEEIVTDYVSIGDYVLTGGELAAMVIIDAVARLVPGVLGNDVSSEEESFCNDLLEYPQYSRPKVWRGKSVPKVLLSGNHTEVARWRAEQARERTQRLRPDLYKRYLTKQELIGRLAKDKRNNIHIMECLSRGQGELLCAEGENVAVYQRDEKICMVKAASPESIGTLLERCPAETQLYVVSQEPVKSALEERGYHALFSCRQMLYTERVPLPVRHKDIRRLGLGNLEYICSHYDNGSREYVEERLQAGVMYGAFVEGRLAGFIGMHTEGSLGMLYVDESCRGRGLGGSLEAYAVNRLLERGWIPYGHVIEGNEVSFRLQEKLGFYQAKDRFWWMERDG